MSIPTLEQQNAVPPNHEPINLFMTGEQVDVHQLLRSIKPHFGGAAACGIVFAFLIAAATYWNLRLEKRSTGERPYAYFELRAIDPNGRAVAGATVSYEREVLGLTDSFGEWRRFMRVQLGEAMVIHFDKSLPDSQLVAHKQLAVPDALPKVGELEIRASVQLNADIGTRHRASDRIHQTQSNLTYPTGTVRR